MFRYIMFLLMIIATSLRSEEPNFVLVGKAVKGKSGYNASNPYDLVSYAKDDKKVDLSTVKLAPTPADAVAYAVADIVNVPQEDQPYQRYVWVPTGDKKLVGAVNYTLNLAWSRATSLVSPQTVAGGRLIRIDLRALAPRFDSDGNDFKEIYKLWEKLSFEPYFHIVRTTDDILPTNAKLIKSAADDLPGSVRFMIDDQTWYKSPAGRTYYLTESGWLAKKLDTDKKENVVVAGAHVGLEQHVILQGLTRSNAPVVRHDFFLFKSLQTLNGGIYYDLLGIERNPKGTTAQKAFFKKFGVDEETIEKLRSDQRVAMFKSRVTGRPRRVDFFRSVGVRPEVGTGLATITFDIAEDDLGADADPIRNLLNFKDKAREVILERANGTHAFALFNNKEELQDSAPDNVVKDHTIPAPYPARLQPAIGCIRCHGPSDGWQPVTNEVKLMLSSQLNVFDDLSVKKKSIPDTLDRLAGLYSGDLSKSLRRARDDYSDVVYRVTNGQTVPQAASTIAGVFLDYAYTDVDALIACRELGYEVPSEKAVSYLNALVPPLHKDILGIAPEDPHVAALKLGLKIHRYQWEAIYADVAFRAMQTRKALNKVK